MPDNDFFNYYDRIQQLKVFFHPTELDNIEKLFFLLFNEKDTKILLKRFFNKLDEEFDKIKAKNENASFEQYISEYTRTDWLRIVLSFLYENRTSDYETTLPANLNLTEMLPLVKKMISVMMHFFKNDEEIPNNIKEATALLIKKSITDYELIEDIPHSELSIFFDISKFFPQIDTIDKSIIQIENLPPPQEGIQ